MTQDQLATKSGLKQSDISKLEKGLMRNTTKGFGLAKALRVPQAWLELGEGPEPMWKTTAGLDAPPAPPAQYRDRNTVSDSQFALLNAVELVLPPAEKRRVLEEAERMRLVAQEQIENMKRFVGAAGGTMIPSVRPGQKKEGTDK